MIKEQQPDPKASPDYEQASKLLVDHQADLTPAQIAWGQDAIAKGHSSDAIAGITKVLAQKKGAVSNERNV